MFDSVVRSAAAAPDPSGVDDEELVELIRGWERLACWAAAGQLAAIAELARRRPRDLLDRPTGAPDAGPVAGDAGHPGLPEVSEFAVDEVAAALRLSRPAAGVRLYTAVELSRLPATAGALEAGVLDVPKVRAVVEAVAGLDDRTAGAVEGRVLSRVGRQTVGQLRAALSRAVLAVDPAAAEVRHGRAVEGRQVRVRALPDGMAELWAMLSADSAAAVYSRIDRLARSAPAGDPRGMDARRADALVATVLRRPTPSHPPTDTPAHPPTDTNAHPPTDSSAARSADTPAHPPPDPAAHRPADSAFPLADTAAHRLADSAFPPADTAAHRSADSAFPPADTSAYPLADTAAHCAAALAPAAVTAPDLVATVHVTVPAATALGLGQEPGELAGHGPVPASMARRLAGAGTWRKLTTDPVTGVVVEVGRTAYTPPAALADLIRARDRTCRFPGCRQPAHRCDLDHVVPWPDGPTSAANLAALCRHHHRLKHQTQWTVRAGPGGDLRWTSPTGHHYNTSPAP